MPIFLVPITLGILIWGAWKLYLAIALRTGPVVGGTVITLIVLAVISLVVWAIRRHFSLHGHRVNGRRVLELSGTWGRLALNAGEKRGNLTLNGAHTEFIFGDIRGASDGTSGADLAVVLQLRSPSAPDWHIPMPNRREAERWRRILTLAAHKRL